MTEPNLNLIWRQETCMVCSCTSYFVHQLSIRHLLQQSFHFFLLCDILFFLLQSNSQFPSALAVGEVNQHKLKVIHIFSLVH